MPSTNLTRWNIYLIKTHYLEVFLKDRPVGTAKSWSYIAIALSGNVCDISSTLLSL